MDRRKEGRRIMMWLRMAVGVLAVVGPVVGVGWLGDLAGLSYVAGTLAQAGAAVGGYLAYVAWVERRRVSELGGPLAGAEFGAGVVLGSALCAAVIWSIWAAGGVAFDGWSVAPDLGYALGMAVVAGVVEELAIRGVVFRGLEAALGSWVALALSAVLFGGLHGLNPGASLWSVVAIALEPGVMLGAAFMLTRRLFLAMGLHMAWNFVQAGVFGLPVSGAEVGGLLISYPVGPGWISGGGFGAEASVLAVLWCGALGLGLLVLARRRVRVVQGRWADCPSYTSRL